MAGEALHIKVHSKREIRRMPMYIKKYENWQTFVISIDVAINNLERNKPTSNDKLQLVIGQLGPETSILV
jgi:hypothetical protein